MCKSIKENGGHEKCGHSLVYIEKATPFTPYPCTLALPDVATAPPADRPTMTTGSEARNAQVTTACFFFRFPPCIRMRRVFGDKKKRSEEAKKRKKKKEKPEMNTNMQQATNNNKRTNKQTRHRSLAHTHARTSVAMNQHQGCDHKNDKKKKREQPMKKIPVNPPVCIICTRYILCIYR